MATVFWIYLVMDVIRSKPLKVVLVVHVQQNNPLYAQSVVRRLRDDGHHITQFDCSSGKLLPILEQPSSPLMNVYQSPEELLRYKTSQSDTVILITDHPVHEVPNHLQCIMQHFSGHVYSWVTYGVTCSLLGGVVRNRQVAIQLRWLLEDSQFLLVGRILPPPCYFEKLYGVDPKKETAEPCVL